MKRFLDDDLFLNTDTSRWLYHDVAEGLPLYDYHGHLRPDYLVNNHRFETLTEIWLDHDHYKWRAMRWAGVDETLITGNADPFEKFLAWARTVPRTLRNPLYLWSHLELRRYFGIDLLLSESTAEEIWSEANRQLATLDTHAILDRFRVSLIGTTDDPLDNLTPHRQSPRRMLTQVVPSLRPDRILALDVGPSYWAYLEQLEHRYQLEIRTAADVRQALAKVHATFHELGCRISDHGFERFPQAICRDAEAGAIFAKARRGGELTSEDRDRFHGFGLRHIAELNAGAGWVQQWHVGATRNLNSRLAGQLGADAGCDAISNANHEPGLRRVLDALDRNGQLAKTILYNLNPADNYVFAALAGSFQQGPARGKVQWGAAWWFLDQQDGIRWHLDALSRLGLLSSFVGMVTDSRSLMSFPRHEYFRRLLCGLIGDDVERGELPADRDLLSELVRDVCFRNAQQYFGFELAETYAMPPVEPLRGESTNASLD